MNYINYRIVKQENDYQIYVGQQKENMIQVLNDLREHKKFISNVEETKLGNSPMFSMKITLPDAGVTYANFLLTDISKEDLMYTFFKNLKQSKIKLFQGVNKLKSKVSLKKVALTTVLAPIVLSAGVYIAGEALDSLGDEADRISERNQSYIQNYQEMMEREAALDYLYSNQEDDRSHLK